MINVTNAAADDVGFITVYPCGGELPLASSLNFVPGKSTANELIVDTNDDGEVCIFVSADTHLIADVVAFVTGR